jgi:hypothetical protein
MLSLIEKSKPSLEEVNKWGTHIIGSLINSQRLKSLLNSWRVSRQITATASEAGIPIGDEDYKSDYVRFNGVENGAHETFLVEFPVGDERYDDSWCKTAGKPYDTAVTACLILAKKLFDADFEVRSDGRWKDWEGGRLLYESVFNIEPKLEDFPNLG